MNEEWRDIEGYEGMYQVSDLGRVRSLDRVIMRRNGIKQMFKGALLRGVATTSGYRQVVLYKSYNRKTIGVHVLVGIAFLGHKTGNRKVIVDHKDNKRRFDDSVANLQIITQRENVSKDKEGCLSKYTGVTFRRNRNTWRALIRHNGKREYLGSFKTELEASNVYQKRLNEIQEI